MTLTELLRTLNKLAEEGHSADEVEVGVGDGQRDEIVGVEIDYHAGFVTSVVLDIDR